MFDGKKLDTEETSDTPSSADVKIISFLKKDTGKNSTGKIPDEISGASVSASALLKRILKKWKDPKNTIEIIGNDDMCMQLLSANYMAAYRKLAKTMKKARTDLDNVDGKKKTDFW